MFWNKREEEIEKLKLNITRLEQCLKEIEERQQKLERILKYEKVGEPTFRVKRIRDNGIAKFDFRPKLTYVIYLYIDREEYVIPVTEFDGMPVTCLCERSRIRVDGDLVYLDLTCVKWGVRSKRLYHFVINYKKATYVCTEEGIHESETEEQKVETETGMVSEEL